MAERTKTDAKGADGSDPDADEHGVGAFGGERTVREGSGAVGLDGAGGGTGTAKAAPPAMENEPGRSLHESGQRARPFSEEARLREREANLRAYARLLDSAIRLPGGFRVGLDGLVGLVPVVGDLVGVGLSGYLVVAAARLGIPRSVVARMIGNVAIESTVGMIPILGDAFDFVFKANERNVRLLERELDRRAGIEPGSRPRD